MRQHHGSKPFRTCRSLRFGEFVEEIPRSTLGSLPVRGAIDSGMQRKYEYRRKLPHYQPDFKAFFITFSTYHRWVLPEPVPSDRDRYLPRRQRKKVLPDAVVVMPDHVHMVLTPKYDANGPVSIAEIMQAHKGSIGTPNQ